MRKNKEQRFVIRIIDVNLNRSREGLRVCEDIARFYLNSQNITKNLKNLRHRISRTIALLPFESKNLFRDRDIESDVGKRIRLDNFHKRKLLDIFFSNIQRTKESLRVLEECSKLFDQGISEIFRALRFKTYGIEKEIVQRLFSLRSSG